MVIISTKMKINSIYDNNTVVDMDTNIQDDAASDKLNFCLVTSQVMIPGHSQSAVLVSCKGAGPMTTETHGNVVERQWSMTVQNLLDILPGKPSYIFYLVRDG